MYFIDGGKPRTISSITEEVKYENSEHYEESWQNSTNHGYRVYQSTSKGIFLRHLKDNELNESVMSQFSFILFLD